MSDCWAIVACKRGYGCVLAYGGLSITTEVEQYQFNDLSDLGLDDAPNGISMWIGSYIAVIREPYLGIIDDSYETRPEGFFRRLVDSEWEYLRTIGTSHVDASFCPSELSAGKSIAEGGSCL